MSSSSPPWHWVWDTLPADGDLVWIRILAQTSKPVLAHWVADQASFTVDIGGGPYTWPMQFVVQWRPQ
jgi:hypothetical protein